MNIVDMPADGTIIEDVVCSHNSNRFHDSPFHQHSNHYELYAFLAGNVTFWTRSSAYPMVRGYLVAIPNGHWHRAVTNDDSLYERIFINIRVDLVKQLSTFKTDLSKCFQPDASSEVNLLKLNEDQLSYFVSLSDKLADVLNHQDDTFGNDIREEVLLSEILLLINQVAHVKNQLQNIIPPLLQKMIQFVDDHLTGDLSLSTISQHFYLNQSYLNRYFKRYMGLSIHKYITERRLDEAKILLKAGNSVTDACNQAGFGNYSNFIRAFTKYTGISPGKYKKSSLAKH
ncbi:helix-turn-helix domain-containing protein [Lentilactobacillus raoultii]|uniref:Helix-turn-helix domain-containing protein n=1 Tax=Lentilactobacillus raoultii TaxID=1987503 RepID=A0ABW3PIW0_9LACO|nr:helix-turn-helix domain-containing protein [Lentilactobacillus raoultii]